MVRRITPFYSLFVMLVVVISSFGFVGYVGAGLTGQVSGPVVATSGQANHIQRVQIFYPDLTLSQNSFKYSDHYLFASNGLDNVSVINPASNSLIGNISTVSGSSGIAITPNGTYLLTVSDSGGGVSVTNLNNLKTVATISTPATRDPGYLVVDQSGQFAYLTGLDSFNISVISLATFTVTTVLNVSFDPSYVAFSHNGSVAVSVSSSAYGGGISNSLTLINATSNKVIRNVTVSQISDPSMAVFSPHGKYLFLIGPAARRTYELNGTTLAFVGFVDNYFTPESIDLNPISQCIVEAGFNPLNSHLGGAYLQTYSYVSIFQVAGPAFNITQYTGSAEAFNLTTSQNGQCAYVQTANLVGGIAIINLPKSQFKAFVKNPSSPRQLILPISEYYGQFSVGEKGLPSGMSWNVTICGQTFSSSTSTISGTFYFGNFSFSIGFVNYYIWVNPPRNITLLFNAPAPTFTARYDINFNSVSRYLFVSNALGYESIASTSNNTLLAELHVGNSACSEAVSPNGTLLLTLTNSGSPSYGVALTVTDLRNLKNISYIPIPSSKGASIVAINPDGKYAYVGSSSHNLTVISMSTFSIVKVMNVTYFPNTIVFTPNGSEGFSFSCSVAPPNQCGLPYNITAFNAYKNTVISNISLPSNVFPYSGAVTPNGSELIVTGLCSHNVTFVSTTSLKDLGSVVIPGNRGFPLGVAVSLNGTCAYVTVTGNRSIYPVLYDNMTVINIRQMSIVRNVFLGSTRGSIGRLALTSNGTGAYLQTGQQNLSYLNLSSMKIEGQVAVTMNGASVYPIIYGTEYYSPITFKETGLPGGTPWEINFANRSYSSSNSMVSLNSYFGSFNYEVPSVNGFSAYSNASGQILVNSTNTQTNIQFRTNVSFDVSGIPSGYPWYLNVTGYQSSGPITKGEVNTSLPNGTFTAYVGAHNYVRQKIIFSVTKSGESFQVNLRVALYTVAFREFNLTAGTKWSVTFGSISENSTGSVITFNVTNGTYSYTLGSVSGYTLSTPNGTIVVNGNQVTQNVSFAPVKSPPSSSIYIYAAIAGIIIIAAVAVAVSLSRRAKKRQ